MERVKRDARKNLFIKSKLGYRRHLPDLVSENREMKARAERQAINGVIQGTAADVMKAAMVQLERAIWHEDWRGTFANQDIADPQPQEVIEGQGEGAVICFPRLLMSIHDEVLYEVHESHVQPFRELMLRVMQQQVPRSFGFSLPLDVHIQVGRRWGEMK